MELYFFILQSPLRVIKKKTFKFQTDASLLQGYYVGEVTENTPYIFNTGEHFVVGKSNLTQDIIEYVKKYYAPINDAPIKIDC